MADFTADMRDIRFVLFEQLDIEKKLLGSERYQEFTREDLDMILDEAYKLAREEMAPANEPGDREGCTLVDGKVKVPEAYRQPYKLYCEAGWLALSQNPEYGGGGAPEVMRIAVDDMMFGANIALNLGMLLTPGAAHLIETFGTDELKQTYCEKMYTGEWAGTMCLTEAQAGTDVGASTAKARNEGDHYLIEGDKVFITFGDHDLTENIVHAVLARIEGAPKGTKGLSLFVVPKYRVNDDGSVGEFNDVVCTTLEHKLGINGSPTCQLSFGTDGKCHGWLLGEENKGMRLMFQMMNEARVAVGLQGAAMGSAAFQAAWAYARERTQGSDLSQMKNPDAPRVPIARHPDVRRMLAAQRAYSEGCRALLYFTAFCEDRQRVSEDKQQRETYAGLVEFLTPICKAYCSDVGFRVAESALQTFGGYGYLKDYPVEQYLRDAKIASIYEGTNGVQAMDLVGRKIGARGGANLMALVGQVNEFVGAHEKHPRLAEQVAALARARDAWGQVNLHFMKAAGAKDFIGPLLNATPYLALCGDLLVGFMLLQQAVISWERLTELCKAKEIDPADGKAVATAAREDAELRYYDSKVKTACYFCANELPQVQAKAAAITSGDTSAMQIVWEPEE